MKQPSFFSLVRFRPIGLLLLLACLMVFTSTANQVVVVRDGKAASTIVVGKDDPHVSIHSREHADITYTLPGTPLADAAHDLAWHLNEMAGLIRPQDRVRVVDDPARARTPNRILLGSAAVETHGLQAEAERIPYPAYVIRTIGNDLLIFGSSAKGAANGVYGFLQDILGVRWFGPQDDFTVAPKMDSISVDFLDEYTEPSFLGRLVHVESNFEHPSYRWSKRRMRMNESVDEGEPFRNSSHNLRRIFPATTFAESHPEFYAMRGGQRQDPTTVPSGNFGLCVSNPDVIDVATEAALSYFRRGDHHHSFSLGINDGAVYCECDDCVALQPERHFRGTRVASDMYFHFVNEVARRVREEFPDRYLGVIAYSDVTAPPLGEVEDNVHVVIVNDISEYFDPAYRARDEELVALWEEKEIPLGLYYYTQLAKLAPAYFPRLLSEELKDKHARGFESVTTEFGQGWPWHGPMAYVESRLLWDVNLDVDELLDEYFQQLYGPASEPMRNVYELFEEIHMRPRSGRFLGEHYQFSQFRPYTAEDLIAIQGWLTQAHDSLGGLGGRIPLENRVIERRLGYVSNGLRVFLAMLEGIAIAQELGESTTPLDNVEAQRQLELIEQLTQILADHEKIYREAITSDSAMPGRFIRDTVFPVRSHWRSRLSTAIGDRLAELTLAANTPRYSLDTRVRDRLEQAVAHYTRSPEREYVFRVKTGEAELGPNLLVNPGFEDAYGYGNHADLSEENEWRRNMPYDWSASPNAREPGVIIDTVLLEDAPPELGSRAARMKNIGESAYLMQPAHGVRPGQAFLCEAYAKLNLSNAQIETIPNVFMRIWWRRQEGGWMRSPAFFASLDEVDEWTRIETVAITPEGANAIAIFLIGEGITDGLEVLFDNVSIRRID